MAIPDQPDWLYEERPVLRPTTAGWIRHILLLLITFCTMTLAGVLFPFGMIDAFPEADPRTASEFFQFVLSLPSRYVVLSAMPFTSSLPRRATCNTDLAFRSRSSSSSSRTRWGIT